VPTILPALAGHPHLTVPMALARGLPFGLLFNGPAWSDGRLLAMSYTYKQATHRRATSSYVASLSATPEVATALSQAR